MHGTAKEPAQRLAVPALSKSWVTLRCPTIQTKPPLVTIFFRLPSRKRIVTTAAIPSAATMENQMLSISQISEKIITAAADGAVAASQAIARLMEE